MLEPSLSLINPKIRKFYAKETIIVNDVVAKHFSANNELNFKSIFEQLSNDPKGTISSYEDFLNYYEKLLPIFLNCASIVENEDIRELHLNLEWLGTNIKYLTEGFDSDETETVQRVLLLTSMLEYGLGSVYYTSKECNRAPPHLLRDLINTNELEAIFGIEAIFFLRILLGTPNSINLRNIVWHGFPTSDEIPSYYVSVLLLTIHSLGSQLKTKEFRIAFRPQLQDFSHHLNAIAEQFIENDGMLENERIPCSCSFLSLAHKHFWYKIFIYYKTKEYWRLVILVLPQIELILRLLYGTANSFDISAKLDEYYITLDTIFEEIAPPLVDAECKPRKNKLLSDENVVTQDALNCVYDLFVTPNGPRLRDKVSHGEVNLSAINNRKLCDILMYLSFALMTNSRNFFRRNYECKFHLNSMARSALIQAATQFNSFVHLNAKIKTNVNLGDICDNEILKHLEDMKLIFFGRPQKESELMLLVLKISKLCSQTCLNYKTSIEERFELLSRRELHSKRRKTLEQLMDAMPQICEALCQILHTLADIFTKAQISQNDLFRDEKTFSKWSRFLKLTLKVTENFVKYSDASSNEWIKTLKLCQTFKDSRDKVFCKKAEPSRA